MCALPLSAADSKVCARCHAEIFRQYAATPMALTSGPAGLGAISGKFSGNGGYQYSVVRQDQKVFLDIGTERRELAYFVGSGAAARSYLIAVDGFLYESPATYYSRARSWGLSPGYDRYSYPFLTRAIAPQCLACHATGVQAVSGTQNGYQSPAFLESGISCERCHGTGDAHAASGNSKDIVNPASLPAEQRDSICAQCHLSGEIRVERAGKSIADFKAGDKLADYAVAFVRASSGVKETGMKVTSHVENLAQSKCSRASGNRLWCGTCHDPHFVPSEVEKVAWFRKKCETCHAPSVCGRGADCVACHMPKSSVMDADHVVYTDHSIPRRPVPRNRKPPADAPLVAFDKAPASTRDQGLAYAIVALREQNAAYSARAFDLLREAEREHPDDPQTLSYLADLYKTRKDDRTAALLYERLLAVDPTQSSAPMNLGAYQMEQGHYEEAIRLFKEALKISPALVLVRLNLAVALIKVGQRVEARAVLQQALKFNPSFIAARNLLDQLQ
jgi:tetratricopeptide repeat protein/cytochrome c554/c'-like protein